ncbi:Faim2 [Symbiodinium microadriaticum]|nr:Faim2 [Symbiodinium sp. KB8]CAE7280023.1 Faim2 [Symbiodinium microadriaticum]
MAATATEQSGLTGGPAMLAGIRDVDVRMGFIRKVYGILGAQMVVTTIIASLITIYGEHLVRYNPALVTSLMVVSMVMSISTMCVFICCPDTMRKSPTNYLLLLCFTVAESVMVGFICVQYTVQSVLVTLGITAALVLALSLFALQTTYDFTGFMPYLFALVCSLCLFGLVMSIFAWNMIYAGLGAVIFSFYIIFDTQLIVGGKHNKFRFSIDDYCMAAINIYVDIIQLFLFLLQLLGDRRVSKHSCRDLRCVGAPGKTAKASLSITSRGVSELTNLMDLPQALAAVEQEVGVPPSPKRAAHELDPQSISGLVPWFARRVRRRSPKVVIDDWCQRGCLGLPSVAMGQRCPCREIKDVAAEEAPGEGEVAVAQEKTEPLSTATDAKVLLMTKPGEVKALPAVERKMPWVLPPGGKLTVMMFGMTGAGKSALGNLIAGSQIFDSGDDTSSITNLDSIMKYEAEDGSLVVLDTIGLGDTEIDQEKVVASIRDVALSALHGVDCLLYVMRNARITDDAIARLIYVTEYLWGDDIVAIPERAEKTDRGELGSFDLRGRSKMTSGVTTVSGRTRDGVPCWDGDPTSFSEFVESARLYEQGTAPHKRAQVAPRIAAELTGSARRFITGQPPDWLSFHGGVERLLDRLREGLGRPKVSEVTEHLNKLFKYSRRKAGESVNEYVARRSETYLRAQQAMSRLMPRTKVGATTSHRTSSAWGNYPDQWSRRTSLETTPEEDGDNQETTSTTTPTTTTWTWGRDSWWNSSPWWEWSSSYGSQWSAWDGTSSWGSQAAATLELPELLPDFIQGWLLLQDANLDSNEKGLVMTTVGDDYSMAAISHALRSLFPDGEMKKRDNSRRQHGFWGAVDEEHPEDDAFEVMDEAEAQESLDAESFAMWSEAQEDIQSAMAALGAARRTLKDARARQHAVKMSRQYYKVGNRPSSSSTTPKVRDDSQIVCLRCQKKGHRAANCPLPPPAAHAASEETASFICFAEDQANTMAEETAKEHQDFIGYSEGDRTEAQETTLEQQDFIGYSEGDLSTGEAALMAGISTQAAVSQGKAIMDCGATRSIGSVYALEKLMEMNIKARGDPGIVAVDTNNRPTFSFGNSSTDQCSATVKMSLRAGQRPGAVQIHALDKGTGPILLSIEALAMLGALVDFRAKMVVLRDIDDQKILPLEQSATGHFLIPLSEKGEVNTVVTGCLVEVIMGVVVFLKTLCSLPRQEMYQKIYANDMFLGVSSHSRDQESLTHRQHPLQRRAMSGVTVPKLREVLAEHGETAPKQWTRIELLQRVEEVTGVDYTRPKKAEKSDYQQYVTALNKAAGRKADLQKYCSEVLKMEVNVNYTIPQLHKEALSVVYGLARPDPSDLVGFGRHSQLTYATVKAEHDQYCQWAVQTAREGQCNPRLRRLAGWVANDVTLVKRAQEEFMAMSKMKDKTIAARYPKEPLTPRENLPRSVKKTPATSSSSGIMESEDNDKVTVEAAKLAIMVETIETLKAEVASLKGERPRKKATAEEVESVTSFSMAGSV